MLVQSNRRIVNLSLEYCFLDGRAIYEHSKGLEVNRTLVSLSLAGNGMSPYCGIKLIQALKVA